MRRRRFSLRYQSVLQVIRKYGAGLVVLTERDYSLCTCGEPNETSHLKKKSGTELHTHAMNSSQGESNVTRQRLALGHIWCLCACSLLHATARRHQMSTKRDIQLNSINHLKTKDRLLHLKTQSVPRSKHFHLLYKNQPVYVVSGTSRCLFSGKYTTHKYSVGIAYSC